MCIDMYSTAVKGRPANATLDTMGRDELTGLTAVKRSHVDDKHGNFWRCKLLLQSKFGLAKHPARPSGMVLLSRFANQ